MGRVIAGWDLAIPRLSLGEKAILKIPSVLAYGEESPNEAVVRPSFEPYGGSNLMSKCRQLCYDSYYLCLNRRDRCRWAHRAQLRSGFRGKVETMPTGDRVTWSNCIPWNIQSIDSYSNTHLSSHLKSVL